MLMDNAYASFANASTSPTRISTSLFFFFCSLIAKRAKKRRSNLVRTLSHQPDHPGRRNKYGYFVSYGPQSRMCTDPSAASSLTSTPGCLRYVHTSNRGRRWSRSKCVASEAAYRPVGLAGLGACAWGQVCYTHPAPVRDPESNLVANAGQREARTPVCGCFE